jgi:hypothetical protein
MTSTATKQMHFLQGCLLALLLFGASSCSTDIDLNAPYQKTAVVFGLLDAQQDTQWVRINRTWLGQSIRSGFNRG